MWLRQHISEQKEIKKRHGKLALEWHPNENLVWAEEAKVMFEDLLEALSGILVSCFLAPAPTIDHPSRVRRHHIRCSCVYPHPAR